MTPADASELLTIAAAFDRRTIGKADAIAWADALQGLDVADCGDAIRDHFRDSTEYLMPAHVRRGVQRIRDERIRAYFSEPDYDKDDVHGGLRAIRRARRAVGDGQPAGQVLELPGGYAERVEKLCNDALAGKATDPDGAAS